MTGNLAVLQLRLDELKAALDAQPDRTASVEWAYDRVQRALQKLAREPARVRIVGGPDSGAVYVATEWARDGCLIVRAA